MAYNYLSIVNEAQRRLNEIELTEANFLTARGAAQLTKDAVNSSVRHINQQEFEWPWNHVEAEEVLLAGVNRYSVPYDAKTISLNTFRIKKQSSLNVDTIRLSVLDYEEYLDKYVDNEYNDDESIRGVPRYITRTPNNEFALHPSPNKNYTLVYEYFLSTFDLAKASDVPSIPEQYRYVIVDGAMYYTYLFRGDLQAANLTLAKFSEGIKNMRKLHINRTEYVRDTRIKF